MARIGHHAVRAARAVRGAAGGFAALVCTVAIAAPETYTLDPGHTYPRWAVSHLGFSTHRGQFNRTRGRLVIDQAAKRGELEVTIEAASISTGDPKLDQHLKNEDFFHVEKHPTLVFRSREMRFEGDAPVAVTGDFTLLGVTRPVTLRISQVKCGPHPMLKKRTCGAEVTGSVRRSEFGMKYLVPAVGDEVALTIQVEAIGD